MFWFLVHCCFVKEFLRDFFFLFASICALYFAEARCYSCGRNIRLRFIFLAIFKKLPIKYLFFMSVSLKLVKSDIHYFPFLEILNP